MFKEFCETLRINRFCEKLGMKEFYETLGTKLIFSRSSHPQSQGKIERLPKKWKDKIRNKIVGTLEIDEPYNWSDE